MAIYADFEPLPVGKVDLWIRVTAPGPVKLEMQAAIEVHTAGQPVTLFTPTMDLAVAQDGELLVEWSSDGSQWKELFRKRIAVGPFGGILQPS